MDLFDYMRSKNQERESPLAARLRPTTIDEVVGQQHILGEGKLLRRAIMADRLGSIILYGPPGTGKTTLAKVIACTSKCEFDQINATQAGKKDMETVVESAKHKMAMGIRTILFIDEIHRFNKGQQDYLLPFVEDGTLILIGATTENPYFEVNHALISRSMIFELRPLSAEDVAIIIKRALEDRDKGLGAYEPVMGQEDIMALAHVAGGDARHALNALELAVLTTPKGEDGKIHITRKVLEDCIQRKNLPFDKNGDNHYDTISAFIKSMRGSDPDAALYYLAKMLKAGEDVKFIARRIMILASEDIGNADPQALSVAASASLAVERVGMPESCLILAQAVIYMATAPKSNSSTCIYQAMDLVDKTGGLAVPPHLRDAHYSGASELGRGLEYKYPHDFDKDYVRQQYLPQEIEGTVFYNPKGMGYEKKIIEWMEFLKSSDN